MEIFDLGADGSRGPLWGLECDDLNATLVSWRPGEGTPDHVNDHRDVLLAVVGGAGTATVDGERVELREGAVVVVPKGARRRIEAGPEGIRYLTVHGRRGGLQIAPPPR